MSRGKRAKKSGSAKFRKTVESNPLVAPPAPAREWASAEFVAAWTKLTEGLQPRAPSKDALAERLALLTAGPPRKTKQLKRTYDPDFRKLKPLVRRTVLLLDALEDQGMVLDGIRKDQLAQLVSKPEAPISPRTLSDAESYRRRHPR